MLADASRQLAAAGVDSPGADAKTLLAHALSGGSVVPVSAADVARMAALDEPVSAATAARFRELIDRRTQRVPLQHLTGVAPFRHLELAVGPGVFIPRPETELLAQIAIDHARHVAATGRMPLVVDLGTGSAAIALAVATEVPQAAVWAVELDATAHRWAQRNVAATRGAEVHLVRGDARTALPELHGRVDIVVANPPYIPPDAVPKDREVADFDPPQALYGLGPDGLAVPRGFAQAAARLLRAKGWFAMEHAEVQAAAARQLIRDIGAYFDPTTQADLAGRPRFVLAQRRPGLAVAD